VVLYGALKLTYDLEEDCECIGGRNLGRIRGLWNRVPRPWRQ
jgi:hypothetical protein